MSSDPVTSLIESLRASVPAGDAGGELAQAAELVPARAATAVPDVRGSELLKRFREQRRQGAVEVAVVDGLFGLVRDLLALKGMVL